MADVSPSRRNRFKVKRVDTVDTSEAEDNYDSEKEVCPFFFSTTYLHPGT